MEWVNETQESAEIMATICSGARIPAVLGLLDGLEATTHHLVIEDVKPPGRYHRSYKTICRQRKDHDLGRYLRRDRPLPPHSEKTLRRRDSPKNNEIHGIWGKKQPKYIS